MMISNSPLVLCTDVHDSSSVQQSKDRMYKMNFSGQISISFNAMHSQNSLYHYTILRAVTSGILGSSGVASLLPSRLLLCAPSFNLSHLRCALSRSNLTLRFSVINLRTSSSNSLIRAASLFDGGNCCGDV
jgi:hypothetical protein